MAEVTWAEPDRPLDPVPAQFRIWEVLLFQALLALLWGPLVLGIHSGVHPADWQLGPRVEYWQYAFRFLAALGPASMAFVIRDKELGAGARFTGVGRVAMAANALAGGCIMLHEYAELGVTSILKPYNDDVLPCICGVLPGFSTALFCGALNVSEAGRDRPFLRWAPLAVMMLQVFALVRNPMIH